MNKSLFKQDFKEDSFFSAQRELLLFQLLKVERVIIIIIFLMVCLFLLFTSPLYTHDEMKNAVTIKFFNVLLVLIAPIARISTSIFHRKKGIRKICNLNSKIGSVTYTTVDNFIIICYKNG